MARRKGGGRPPGVTKDEAELFRRTMGEAKPLAGKDEEGAPPPVDDAPEFSADPPPEMPAPPAPRPHGALPDLRLGETAGVDRRTAERLRRGKLAIDGRIDLHHHTQAEAHGALTEFIIDAAATGRRCVLVITGKGAVSEGGGVIRRRVPQWLNLPPLREHVLAIAQAKIEHGGTGALYVLLRRRR